MKRSKLELAGYILTNTVTLKSTEKVVLGVLKKFDKMYQGG